MTKELYKNNFKIIITMYLLIVILVLSYYEFSYCTFLFDGEFEYVYLLYI